MPLKTILALGLAAVLAGCSTIPPQIAKTEGRVLVKGTKTSNSHVFIRVVDGGQPLFVRGYRLGSEAWLSPGTHDIEVMCEFTYEWGTKILPGSVGFDVRPGAGYLLEGTMDTRGEHCMIEVRASR